MLAMLYPSVCLSLVVGSWLIAPGLWTLAQTLGALWLVSLVGRWITAEIHAFIGGKPVDPKGKAVLITGCDSGFGLELAMRLHARGMRVFAGCLLPDSLGATKLQALSATPAEEGKGSMHVIAPMDVTSDRQVQDAVQQVKKILASEDLWALVANAGVIWATELEWGSLEPMRRMLEVNAVGVARTVRAFLPMVRRAKGGRVVITTSLWGYFSIPFSVAYSMSKCAARFFADGLRREMKKFGVRVVSIEPNMYATNLTADGILLPAMDKLWQETSEEVRRDYGQRYYELSRQYLRRELLKSRTEIHEVVDAMETAVLAQRPRFAYRPDGLLRAFQFRLLEIAPPVVQDAFLIRDTQPPASTLPGNRGIARG
nr:LOW QUALITY PROTEIN: short-chain dehydrogenase/reductase family 9C member 7-like [Rhipicephalus microplus]